MHAMWFIARGLVNASTRIGLPAPAMRDGKKQTIRIRHEQRRSSAGCRRDVGDPCDVLAALFWNILAGRGDYHVVVLRLHRGLDDLRELSIVLDDKNTH
jgi:hypothetical protein